MNFPRSLLFRILVVTIPTLLIASLLNLYIIARIFESSVTGQYDLRLKARVERVVSLVQSDLDDAAIQSQISSGDFANLFWQIRNQNGGSLTSDPLMLPSTAVPQPLTQINEIQTLDARTLTDRNVRLMVRSFARPDGSATSVAVGADRQALDEQIGLFYQSLQLFLTGLILVAILTGLLQYFVMQHTVGKLQGAIHKLQSGESGRLSGRFPSELDPLIGNLNDLIQQNEDIVTNARMQATNLAHTIKTPLAIIKNEITELSNQNPDLNVAELNTNLEKINRMSRFYLARARTTNSLLSVPVVRKIQVRPIVFEIVEAIRRLHQDKPVRISYRCANDATFSGDEIDLEELLGTLLDNAAKWANSRVELNCSVNAGQLSLVVSDDGPGIAVAERSKILEPGIRLDDTVQGTGHGLSIAVEIVRSYGGDIQLGDAEPRGLQAIVTLPIASVDANSVV